MKFSTVVLCAAGSAFLSSASAGFCGCCKEKVNPGSQGDSGGSNQAPEDLNDITDPSGKKKDLIDSASGLEGGSNLPDDKKDATKNADTKTSGGGADSSEELNGDTFQELNGGFPSNLNGDIPSNSNTNPSEDLKDDLPSNLNQKPSEDSNTNLPEDLDTNPSADNDNLHPIPTDGSATEAISSEANTASETNSKGSTFSDPIITPPSNVPTTINSSSSKTDKSNQGSEPENTVVPASPSLDTQDDASKVNPSEISSLDNKPVNSNVPQQSTAQANLGEGKGEEKVEGEEKDKGEGAETIEGEGAETTEGEGKETTEGEGKVESTDTQTKPPTYTQTNTQLNTQTEPPTNTQLNTQIEPPTNTQIPPPTGPQSSQQPESQPWFFQRAANYLPSFSWNSSSEDKKEDQSDNLSIF